MDFSTRLTLVKSGIEPNPECDQGEHRFTYSLYPHAGDWRCGTIPEAYCLNQPAMAMLVRDLRRKGRVPASEARASQALR